MQILFRQPKGAKRFLTNFVLIVSQDEDKPKSLLGIRIISKSEKHANNIHLKSNQRINGSNLIKSHDDFLSDAMGQ